MNTINSFMSRFFISFIMAITLSFIFEKGYWLLFWLLYPDTILAGGKSAVFVGIFMGVPIGDVIGIIINEKYNKKIKKPRISGLFLAAFLALIGSFLSLFFSFLVTPWVMLNVISPLIATSAALIGYDITTVKNDDKT
jgi:hypothetical protein